MPLSSPNLDMDLTNVVGFIKAVRDWSLFNNSEGVVDSLRALENLSVFRPLPPLCTIVTRWLFLLRRAEISLPSPALEESTFLKLP